MDKIDTLLEKVWDYAKPESENSYEYVLSDEFFLFQHIAHLAYHVKSGGCSVRYFMDLHLLKNKLSYDNEKVCEMLKMCGLDAFFSTCVKMCDVWFSDGEHDETTLLFQRYLLNGGIYGTKHNQIAASPDKKSMVAYILNRVFMPYEQLCVTYPSLKGKKMLIPFYQIRRWLRIVANRRLDSASEEFKAKKHVSDGNFGDYSKLFEAIKLN